MPRMRNEQSTAVQCVKKIWDVYEDDDSIDKPVKRLYGK